MFSELKISFGSSLLTRYERRGLNNLLSYLGKASFDFEEFSVFFIF
jgi:hypothetical protein